MRDTAGRDPTLHAATGAIAHHSMPSLQGGFLHAIGTILRPPAHAHAGVIKTRHVFCMAARAFSSHVQLPAPAADSACDGPLRVLGRWGVREAGSTLFDLYHDAPPGAHRASAVGGQLLQGWVLLTQAPAALRSAARVRWGTSRCMAGWVPATRAPAAVRRFRLGIRQGQFVIEARSRAGVLRRPLGPCCSCRGWEGALMGGSAGAWLLCESPLPTLGRGDGGKHSYWAACAEQ